MGRKSSFYSAVDRCFYSIQNHGSLPTAAPDTRAFIAYMANSCHILNSSLTHFSCDQNEGNDKVAQVYFRMHCPMLSFMLRAVQGWGEGKRAHSRTVYITIKLDILLEYH